MLQYPVRLYHISLSSVCIEHPSFFNRQTTEISQFLVEALKQLGSNSLSKEDFGKYLNTAQYTSLFGATQDGFRMVNNKKQSVIEMWLGHPINNNNNTPSNSVATHTRLSTRQ